MSDNLDVNLLQAIKNSLDEVKSILTLVNAEKLEETKKKLLPEGSIKRRIYELCDGTRTTKELADAIKKEVPYVNSYLSILRREGLIRTMNKDGTQIHEQAF